MRSKNKKKKNLTIFLIAIFCLSLVTMGSSCKAPTPEDFVKEMGMVSLTYWTTWEESVYLAPIIAAYSDMHPNVEISILRLRPEEYEDKLLYNFALDSGPDIFSIHNTWVKKYDSFIIPMLPKTNLPYVEVSGPSWHVERKIINKDSALLSVSQMRQKFVDQVARDAIISEQIYGVPFFVDTPVLFYNINLLNNANIAEPPKNWDDFQNNVKELTKFDTEGNIAVAGTALGTSNNVERFSDILATLMMQNGTTMMNGGTVTFNQLPAGSERTTLPSKEAIEFYTSFADPIKDVYSWNEDKINSYREFVDGNLAFFFGYSYHLRNLNRESKKVNFSYTGFPQITNTQRPINYANYWLETVSKKSKHPDYAWDFLNFATNEAVVPTFLNTAKKPTALRPLIEGQKQDPVLEPFASQLLTAHSWYQGARSKEAETALADMIDAINKEEATIDEALVFAAQKVQLTIPKPQ